MPVATCPRIISLSRGRALWARALARKYFLCAFLFPPLSLSLSLSLSFSSCPSFFPFFSLLSPLEAFHFSPSQRVRLVELKFPQLDLVCINYPSLYSVLRVIADAHARTNTRIHPPTRVHTCTHTHGKRRRPTSVRVYRRAIADIYRVISILLSEQCICLWRRKVFDRRPESNEKEKERANAGRGRRMPTGHSSFYAYVCICMHTHATPAGYKHLPIMLASAASRVKGPLNSNGGGRNIYCQRCYRERLWCTVN